MDDNRSEPRTLDYRQPGTRRAASRRMRRSVAVTAIDVTIAFAGAFVFFRAQASDTRGWQSPERAEDARLNELLSGGLGLTLLLGGMIISAAGFNAWAREEAG